MKQVLVLGAGATRAEAERVSGAQLPPLDRGFFGVAQSLGNAGWDLDRVARYMRDHYRVDVFSNAWDSMEAVLAVVVSDCEQMSKPKHNSACVLAVRSLLAVYQHVLKITTESIGITREAYVAAWIDRHSSEGLSVVTFNHDLICERAAAAYDASKKSSAPFLSIPECYGSPLTLRSSAGEGRVTRLPSKRGSARLSLFKLHGSLNWRTPVSSRPKYREMMGGRLNGLRWTSRVEVPEGMEVSAGKRRRTKTLPVVVPPVRNKSAVMSAELREHWKAAEQALSAADQVTFFGYSCPSADTEAEGLFRRALGVTGWGGEVTVVNPDPSAVARFADFVPGRPITYHRSADDWLR